MHDFRQVGAQPLDLGSYQVTFDGSAPSDGAVVGSLRDLGGPFAVNGTVTLTPPNAYLVQGYITGRTAEAERLVREITLGAMPDPSGRSTFSFEGLLSSCDVHFPPGRQQREVQAGAHRLRTELARQVGVTSQLRFVTQRFRSPESRRDRRPRGDWS